MIEYRNVSDVPHRPVLLIIEELTVSASQYSFAYNTSASTAGLLPYRVLRACSPPEETYTPSVSPTTSVPSSTPTGSPTSATSHPTIRQPPTGVPTATDDGAISNTGVMAGAVGGALGVLAIAAAIVALRRRKNRLTGQQGKDTRPRWNLARRNPQDYYLYAARSAGPPRDSQEARNPYFIENQYSNNSIPPREHSFPSITPNSSEWAIMNVAGDPAALNHDNDSPSPFGYSENMLNGPAGTWASSPYPEYYSSSLIQHSGSSAGGGDPSLYPDHSSFGGIARDTAGALAFAGTEVLAINDNPSGVPQIRISDQPTQGV
jgi:hypothetical protein